MFPRFAEGFGDARLTIVFEYVRECVDPVEALSRPGSPTRARNACDAYVDCTPASCVSKNAGHRRANLQGPPVHALRSFSAALRMGTAP